jgi:hypothetical protein
MDGPPAHRRERALSNLSICASTTPSTRMTTEFTVWHYEREGELDFAVCRKFLGDLA